MLHKELYITGSTQVQKQYLILFRHFLPKQPVNYCS